jgi:hypothetical protein
MMIALIVPGLLITLLGICYWFIPMGTGERSGFLATIILSLVMFLVMLTTFVPLSRRIPLLGGLFLGYVSLLVVMSCVVICLEARYLKLKKQL